MGLELTLLCFGWCQFRVYCVHSLICADCRIKITTWWGATLNSLYANTWSMGKKLELETCVSLKGLCLYDRTVC